MLLFIHCSIELQNVKECDATGVKSIEEPLAHKKGPGKKRGRHAHEKIRKNIAALFLFTSILNAVKILLSKPDVK